MFDRLRAVLLRYLRVPPEPEPPFGAPGSVRVFRAGRNYYRLRLLGWGVGQVGALIGILFSLGFLHQVKTATGKNQDSRTNVSNAPTVLSATNHIEVVQGKAAGSRDKDPKRQAREWVARLVAKWPRWIFPAVTLLELAGLGFYFIQALLTYAAVRLDFELRWYVVTDRSLRIRSGVWSVQEMTMSFANLQQVIVSQGPLQRLLGIADVRVESAGGGGSPQDAHGHHVDSTHTGFFHGVDNATEVRDLILDRLRSFRETGLGDPDEMSHATPLQAEASQPEIAFAARELLVESRALRAAVNARR